MSPWYGLGMDRPACVVRIWDIEGEKRPRFTKPQGVGSIIRRLGDATGLQRMGVNLRTVEPGLAGTNRHYHLVEEEWTYVVSGSGTVRIGAHRLPVRTGSFVGFPPGPRPHHFLAEGNQALVLLEGGERRPKEDYGFYPDLGARFSLCDGITPITEALPAEEGDASQCVHVDDLPRSTFEHDVDRRAHRIMRRLNRTTGLTRQAVVWSQVEPGSLSTALHTHDRTDEWILILTGRARVTVGADTFEVGPHDFIGHPAGSPAHVMEPIESLTYLMGGQIDADDVVTYPQAGVRRIHGKLEPLP
jgi:uncharacterized cupin superfamily protein